MDYDHIFTKRGNDYKYATEKYPEVLDNEFNTVIKMCQLEANQTMINIPAACVPLHEYITDMTNKKITYLAFETNPKFAELTNIPVAKLDNIPLANNTIDIIVSVASLHHSTDIERQNFYFEAKRILKPTGRLIIADVIAGSQQDKWLNEFCNKYSSVGHKGKFWSKNDARLLESVGYNPTISIQEYTWDFPDQKSMLDYCRHLFGLDLINDDAQLLSGINEYLHPITNPDTGAISIPWQLIYFISTIYPTHALPHQ